MKDNSDRKEISLIRKLLFSVIAIIIFLFILEGGIRLFYFVRGTMISRTRSHSKELGWKTIANVKSKKAFNGYGEINYSTTKYGKLGTVRVNV